MKTCGSCTLCCSLMPVKEIGLQAFTRCRALTPPWQAKQGCAIYAKRPVSCRLWSCLWLQNDEWPDELQPSRCGVVFDATADLIKIGVVEGGPAVNEMPCAQAWVSPSLKTDPLENDAVASVVLALLDKGLAVLFRLAADRAFAVWKTEAGLHRSKIFEPASDEPDATRLRRARAMVAALPDA